MLNRTMLREPHLLQLNKCYKFNDKSFFFLKIQTIASQSFMMILLTLLSILLKLIKFTKIMTYEKK